MTADGEPVADVTVIAGDDETTTGTDGRYSVDPVPQGSRAPPPPSTIDPPCSTC